MELVLKRIINCISVDGYVDNAEAWFTRTQIGELLGYSDPQNAILKIHQRHKERLDKFSKGCQIDTPSGKQQGYVYNIRGVFEICRWSDQPQADEVMDKLYDMAEDVIRKGYYSSIPDTQLSELLIANMNDKERLEHVIIPAMRESNIDQAVFAAKLTGMTLEEFRHSKILIEKAIKNEEAKSKLDSWRSRSRFINHIFCVEDLPSKYKDRFYMDGLVQELSRKKAYRDFFADSYGKMYFNRDGYMALLDVMEARRWITQEERRKWEREEGLV